MQNDTKTALAICAALAVLLSLFLVLKPDEAPAASTDERGAVSMQGGVQVINVTAKGGYVPGRIEAKAGVPTELRVTTSATFDCSASLVIPSLGYQTVLRPTGVEAIAIPADMAQGTVEGTCGMGMYDFAITFI